MCNDVLRRIPACDLGISDVDRAGRPDYSELSPEETSAKVALTVTSIEGIVAIVVERNGFARI